MTFKFIFAISFFLILLTSCQPSLRQQTKGLTVHNQPTFWYQLIKANSAAASNPKTGDQLSIQYTLGKKDTILASSYIQKRPTLVQLPDPKHDIFFTKALRLMQAGDSMVLAIPADSIRQYLGEHSSQFKKKELVWFHYKVLTIKSEAQLHQELQIEKQRAEGLNRLMGELLTMYQKDSTLSNTLKRTDTGLKYYIHQAGEGETIKTGNAVQIHYICSLLSGQQLGNSYLDAQPLDFLLGDHKVILGLEQALLLLREKSQAFIVIPADLAYGSKGNSAVPPNATLFFWVEVLSVE